MSACRERQPYSRRRKKLATAPTGTKRRQRQSGDGRKEPFSGPFVKRSRKGEVVVYGDVCLFVCVYTPTRRHCIRVCVCARLLCVCLYVSVCTRVSASGCGCPCVLCVFVCVRVGARVRVWDYGCSCVRVSVFRIRVLVCALRFPHSHPLRDLKRRKKTV